MGLQPQKCAAYARRRRLRQGAIDAQRRRIGNANSRSPKNRRPISTAHLLHSIDKRRYLANTRTWCDDGTIGGANFIRRIEATCAWFAKECLGGRSLYEIAFFHDDGGDADEYDDVGEPMEC